MNTDTFPRMQINLIGKKARPEKETLKTILADRIAAAFGIVRAFFYPLYLLGEYIVAGLKELSKKPSPVISHYAHSCPINFQCDAILNDILAIIWEKYIFRFEFDS